VSCRSIRTRFSSAFSAFSAVRGIERAFQYASSSRKYWKTPGKSPLFGFKGKEAITSLARSYDTKMTTSSTQRPRKTSKMDSPGPPLRSPRFPVHPRPSAVPLPSFPNHVGIPSCSNHPKIPTFPGVPSFFCNGHLLSLRSPRPPRLPPIRAFFTTSEFQPISLSPSALCQISRPPKGPKRPEFSPSPRFLAHPPVPLCDLRDLGGSSFIIGFWHLLCYIYSFNRPAVGLGHNAPLPKTSCTSCHKPRRIHESGCV